MASAGHDEKIHTSAREFMNCGIEIGRSRCCDQSKIGSLRLSCALLILFVRPADYVTIIDQHSSPSFPRKQLQAKLQLFADQPVESSQHPGDVASWSGTVLGKTKADGVSGCRDDNRDAWRNSLCRQHSRRTGDHDYVWIERSQFGREPWQSAQVAISVTVLDLVTAVFYVTQGLQFVWEAAQPALDRCLCAAKEHSNERPMGRGLGKCPDRT